MNEIEINITGPTGSGKTTLARLFEEWLRYNNFDVENQDKIDAFICNEETFQQNINAVSEKTKIKIRTTQKKIWPTLQIENFNISPAQYIGAFPTRQDINIIPADQAIQLDWPSRLLADYEY